MGESPSIVVTEKGVGGHALSITVRSEMGEAPFSAEKFRSLLGYHNLRSTLFQVTRRPNSNGTPGDVFIFHGDGFGHGVGLCQFGAQEMAEHGAACSEILAFYFPKGQICVYSSERMAGARERRQNS